MSVTLENSSGRMLVFVLDHETYCSARQKCACDDRGSRKPRVPCSLTLPAGSRTSGVDEAVLGVGAIRRAIRAGSVIATPEPAVMASESPVANEPSTSLEESAEAQAEGEPQAPTKKKRGNA